MFYCFGDGRKITATGNITFPTKIGRECINIQSAILNSDTPLLFLRLSIKKAEMKMNFHNDTMNIIGKNIPLLIM